MTSTNRTEQERAERIRLLTDALKRDPDHPYRKEITREYLDLTDPEPNKEIDI